MNTFKNKNEKQITFSTVKGTIEEINDAEKYCSVTIKVGHENFRFVNVIVRKSEFDKMMVAQKIGDKVVIRYFLSSHKKNERWYTSANMLDIHKEDAVLNFSA